MAVRTHAEFFKARQGPVPILHAADMCLQAAMQEVCMHAAPTALCLPEACAG